MLIKDARIIDPATGTNATGDIHIEDGKIKKIYIGGSKIKDAKTINAQGLWAVPGLIDMHVHLREPGFEYKEDIHSGTLAAAAGGVTTVACMANTDPVNDCPAVTEYIVKKAKTAGVIRVLPVGAVTKGLKGQELAEMGLMKKAGIIAVSDDGQPIESASVMRRALEYASTFGLPLLSHCQDKSLSASGVMNESALSSVLGLPGIPSAADDVMVARDVVISEYTDIPVHITHISTKGSLEIIKQAKSRGVCVTCDVTPHNLLLSEEKMLNYDSNAKMYPPLREDIDRFALIKGIKAGIIDCIATDHAPHAKDEKDLDLELAPNGVIGLETLLPAILQIHYEFKIDIMTLIACVTTNPAKILGIDGGDLKPGSRADITLINPDMEWVVNADEIKSKSKNSAFLGETFTGRAAYTIYEGKVVYKL